MMKWKLSIPPLEDLTIPQRIVLTMALVVLILFILFALGTREEATGEVVVQKYCVTDEEARERIRGFMFTSLDQALHDNFEHLFAVWMKDARGQPERARVGVAQAIEAHKTARILATEWLPPVCPGVK